MRKISDLLKIQGCKIYVLAKNKDLNKKLIKQAVDEGFTVIGQNGLYLIKSNKVLQSVGFIDHVCFGSMASSTGLGTKIIRIDYEKFISDNSYY